ncbi:MAG TPA: hypothetical protein VMU07_01050 [Candidatus Paceibacterota bacterium]|nr:hypothetical protein [Candidatus Paceibacterota bacterium]
MRTLSQVLEKLQPEIKNLFEVLWRAERTPENERKLRGLINLNNEILNLARGKVNFNEAAKTKDFFTAVEVSDEDFNRITRALLELAP